ncbi:MAG TPA: hypothetical protein VGW96_04620 [Candidatus Eremiobacteraceae bacterium]|nr:hypothetical protein [Candidatus Eremiobacteraceae bacterium]
MIESLQSLRTLRHILVRLGAGPTGGYWSSSWRIFASNLFGGIMAGAVASIFAAVILGIDLHRGKESFLYQVVSVMQTIIVAIQTLINRELP